MLFVALGAPIHVAQAQTTSSTSTSVTTSTSTGSTTTLSPSAFKPPDSTFTLTLVAVTFALISNLLILRFVDLKAERRMKAEIDAWTKDLRAAQKAGDKKTEEKLKKKEQTIAQMRLKMSGGRMKVTLITFVPFIAFYYLLLKLLGAVPGAYSPFYVPYLMTTVKIAGHSGYEVTTFGWYFISSLSFSGLLTRLLKTQP